MLWIYRLLFLPALLLASPYYLLRMRRRGGYGAKFGQRFGATDLLPAKRPGVKRLWLQAVSVGEMLAVAPILDALAKEATVEVYLTTTTSTGYKIAVERYRGKTIGIGYFPTDWWLFSARAWRRVRPDLVVLTEGERWPEHIAQARERGVPVVCVNGRLSDRSFRRMQTWSWAAKPLLAGISRVLACSPLDAERFCQIGLPAERVTSTGNIKLDVAIPLLSSDEKRALRRELGVPDGVPVLLGSSTWPGEEQVLLGVWRDLKAAGHAVHLVLVPRHVERRAEIDALLAAAEVTAHFRSRGAAPNEVAVSVGDTTGELRKITQLADLVFVGKSLAPHTEGQTPVEAAVLGRALLFGPGMGSFRTITEELLAGGGALRVDDGAALGREVSRLLRDEQARAALGGAAQQWHRANQGAVERTMAELRLLVAR